MTGKDLQDLENQWKDMNRYLMLNTTPGLTRDYVFDRLVWLKKRINGCRESSDYKQVLNYFNETVLFFNQELNLSDEVSFKER